MILSIRRKITKAERNESGHWKIEFECGHTSLFNGIFFTKVGDESKCFKCDQIQQKYLAMKEDNWKLLQSLDK